VSDTPRFTHNAFPTAHLDASVAFYEGVAGMRVVKSRGDRGDRVFWLAPADADLPIFVLVERPAPVLPARSEPLLRHLGFAVDDRAALEILHERIAAMGLDVTDPEYVDEIVGHIFIVRDPDGRAVEFSAGQDVSPANWDADARPAR